MNIIKKLLDSRKFVVALLGVGTAIALELGVEDIQIEEIIAILSPVLAYIGAQGFADGMERKA